MRTGDPPMRYDTDPRRLEYMSKNEGRKLMLFGLVLVISAFYVFSGRFDGDGDQPEVGIGVPRPSTASDAQATRDTMARVAAEQAGEVERPESAAELELDPSILQSADDEAIDLVEEPAFYHLLAFVNSLDDEAVATAEERYGDFTWEELRSGPEGTATWPAIKQARGRFTTLKGRFLTDLHQRVLARYPNEAGLAWVWQGTFKVGPRRYYVTLCDKTFEPETGINGTPIELTGAFLKVYRFRPVNAEQDSVRSLPHLVVKKMRRLEPTAVDGYPYELAWFVAISASVAALAILLYAGFSRRSGERLEGWRRARLAKRVPAGARPPANKGGERPAPGAGGEVVGGPVAPASTCPACRRACAAGPAATVCADCLTRHHGACWDAAGRCSACSGANALVARAERPAAPPPEESHAADAATESPGASQGATADPTDVTAESPSASVGSADTATPEDTANDAETAPSDEGPSTAASETSANEEGAGDSPDRGSLRDGSSGPDDPGS